MTRDRAPTETGPPPLGAREQALESKLAPRAHAKVSGLPWWRRTQEFARTWDLMRRRRLGLLHTVIPAFTPLWEHPFWRHFNKGRQQADLLGASYEDYLSVQINRSLRQTFDELDPADLHGKEALEAFRSSQDTCDEYRCRVPAKPPFARGAYDHHNPIHRAYAEGMLREMLDLAQYICSDGEHRTEDLLASAVCQFTLPLRALNDRPRLKDEVERLVKQRGISLEASESTGPGTII